MQQRFDIGGAIGNTPLVRFRRVAAGCVATVIIALFAVAQVLNKTGDVPFDAGDERRFQEFATSLGVVLESWWRMDRARQERQGAPPAG